MTEQHDEPVEVTQADRDAAAALHLEIYGDRLVGDPVARRLIVEGRADSHRFIQAFARHRLATRPTPSSDMVEAMARAIRQHHVTRTIYEGPGKTRARRLHSGDREAAQAAATVIAEAMAAKDAELAELRAEIEVLRTNAKANNDLARMNKAQADEFRAKYVVASETLDFIAPSLPVLRDMLTRAKMPKGASKAAEMIEAVSVALGSAE